MMVLLAWMNVGAAASCKVLAVMAYQDDFVIMEAIKEGIEEILGETCDIRYAYLNALSEPQYIEERAKETYTLYQEFQPDGVIATNNEAQEYFVVPYLKGKVDTPVIFCDVGEAPEVFGYPTNHITGILKRPFIADTIVFAQQIDPGIKTVGFLFAKEPTSDGLAKQISAEADTYTAEILEPSYVTTFDEALATTKDLKEQADALFIGPIGRLLVDSAGNLIPMSRLVTGIAQEFGKPTMTIWEIVVQSGALCAVSDFSQEQGRVAAEMLQKTMQGTPVSEFPITQNQFGQRIVNKTVLKELGITPSRQVLTGVDIMETLK
jgi:ABC-type uncharacterized transport system substrate-binding protein